jgi:hypothetical protein
VGKILKASQGIGVSELRIYNDCLLEADKTGLPRDAEFFIVVRPDVSDRSQSVFFHEKMLADFPAQIISQ